MVAITSQQDLLLHMRALEITYHQHNISRALKRTQPFVAQIRSFTQIINIFIQSDPKISALVWGPCALVLELAARHEDTLELIGELFEKFERVLPRFQEYLKEFGSRALTGRLEQALVTYYSELIAFYQDAIRFLSVRPWKNILLIKRPAIQFNLAAKRRLATLREKTSWVEDEVGWTKYQIQQDQHKMIVDLLNSGNGIATAAAPRFKLPYRSLPYARNYEFHFRENILEQLASCLQPKVHRADLRTASLYGLGGVGKTQVALEFAYRYAEHYDAIFWIKADTESGLRESFYTHARAVDDRPEAAPQQDATLIKGFLDWLMTARNDEGKLVPWLLIFDNVDDARLIERFWPKGSHRSVLVTTRNREVSVTFGNNAFQVELFTEVESAAFMKHFNPYTRNSDDEELRLVSQITDRLGHLPLVLDHIGSYIRTTSSSYRTFLRFYKDFDTNLLFESGSLNLSYERSIRNTWTMSLTTIDPAARAFMELLVLFEPDGVPLQLFEACDEAAKMYNGPSEEFPRLDECLKGRLPNRKDTDTVISALIAASLISRGWEGDLVSCHRIVREAVLKSLAPETLALHFDWAVFALNACFPKTPYSAPLLKDWDQCAIFHPHVSTLVAIFMRYSDSMPYPILLCEVIRRCAWYLFERGNYKASTEMATVACKMLEKASDHGVHPGYFPRYICRLTADMYTMLGSIEYELNLPMHGQHWFQKSDQHRRRLLEDDNAEAFDLETMAIVDCNRALAVLADGPADAAIASCRLLLNTFDNESSRGIWAANLSIAYRLNNELTDSLEWCQKSQEWTSVQNGKDSLSMAIVHFNTGCTFLAMKKDDLALHAFEQCLAIRREKSAFHPYTGFTCHKIGLVLRARGDLSHAVTLFRSAIQILQNCESHEGATVRSKNSLAVTLEEMGAFDEAEALRREIVVSLNSLGKPFTQDDRNVSEAYFEQFVLYCHR